MTTQPAVKQAKPENILLAEQVKERMLKVSQPQGKAGLVHFPGYAFEDVSIPRCKLPLAVAVFLVRNHAMKAAEAARAAGANIGRAQDCVLKSRRIDKVKVRRALQARFDAYVQSFSYCAMFGSMLTKDVLNGDPRLNCYGMDGKSVIADHSHVTEYELLVIWQDAIRAINANPMDWVVAQAVDPEGAIKALAVKRCVEVPGRPNYRLTLEDPKVVDRGVVPQLFEVLDLLTKRL